ncbi:C1 family peptidase [uncultured Methanobrevibacter sp.]|uniref:C1 family peptidase n=1 Tax=uncultured Methanobrevibacter sp. TaxID=253161 RepID=UPI002621C110|nr:C1 family peptidase [uncultured Methanobrevibacter sp.]
MAIVTLSAVSASDIADNTTSVSYETQTLAIPTDENTNEDTPLESSKPGTFTELQAKINTAEIDSTIYLTKDYYYNDDFKGRNGITIDKNIKIFGEGHTIDGMGKSKLLLITETGVVELHNIKFTNGKDDSIGVISIVNSFNIDFNECNFTNNNVSSGTVYLANSSYCNFYECDFNNNTAQYTGGAVFLTNNHHNNFIDCSFRENKANYGGAIYLTENKNLKFNYCKFDNNNATYTGGSIYSSCNSGTNYKQCTFENNTAEDGGSIYIDTTNQIAFSKCTFTANNASYKGGAIYLSKNDNLSIIDCHFDDNNASYTGGAIYLENNTQTAFAYDYFYNNYASKSGGAIYLTKNDESIFQSCRFTRSYADCGAAIATNNSDIYLISCGFINNKGYNGSCIHTQESHVNSINSYFMNSNVKQVGGSIYSVASSLNIINNGFEDNTASESGGDIYSKYSMINLENSEFTYSQSYGFGGSLSFNDDYVNINKCTFERCVSWGEGGGVINCLNSIVNCSSSEFTKCISLNVGGTICSLNTDLTINQNKFKDSYTFLYGGTIYSIYGSISINGSDFVNSNAQKGGALYIRSPYKINSITNNRFLYSSSTGEGPRIYVDEYNGEIPEFGNIYEDIYFVMGNFSGSSREGDNYQKYSNIITYVVSNSNDYQNDLSYYNNLRYEFALNKGVEPAVSDNNVYFSIFDKDAPDNSTIFLNYNEYQNRTVIYNATHFCENLLNLRMINLKIYNSFGFELTSLLNTFITSIRIINETETEKTLTILAVSRNDTQTNGWWTRPIFDDESRLNTQNNNNNQSSFHSYSVNPDEFPANEFSGKFSFNFEDRNLESRLGNVYEFKNDYYLVPLLNYTTSTDYLPSHYDSRDYGYVTPVKDQSIGRNCWAFSGIAALEACLKKATGKTYDLSENNAKNLMAAASIYGLNIDSNAGGYDAMFIGYLTSWLGPVNEKNDKYNPLSSISPLLPPLYHIQDISFISPRANSSDNDEYKKAIINNGAVSVIFDWTSNYTSYGLHSVCLIGWDDKYNNFDSIGNYAKGAWIFKNSWGDEWEDEGFGYISYEQKLSEEIYPYFHAYTFIFNESDIGYQDIYQYDFAGLSDFLNVKTDCIYYKNKFTAKGDEYLTAFSTYFESPTDFTFSINKNGKEVTTTENGTPIENSIRHAESGYHTIRLGYDIRLTPGDEFEIIIKLINPYKNSIPVCQADELYKLSYPSNVSFYSQNGKDWFDIYDLDSEHDFAYGGLKTNTCQVACIKAFTTTCGMDFVPLALTIITPNGVKQSVYFDLYKLSATPIKKALVNQSITIQMTLEGWNSNNNLFENLIEVRIGNNTYYSPINNGKSSTLTVKLDKSGNYSFSAKLKSNHYSSNLVEFNFTVENVKNGTFTKLQEIIDNADKESTITLDDDYYSDYSSVNIFKGLTIDGNGHYLDGSNSTRIFTIYVSNVTLKNINFRNAKTAVFSIGKLNIINCTFSDNYGTNGGAITSHGECIIENSTFYSNNATNGAAIYSYSNLTVNNCNFKNNNAENSGGAIYCKGYQTVSSSNFEYNHAKFGGAIDVVNDLTICESRFNDNMANATGGAIYCSGLCKIDSSIFNKNNAKWAGAIYTTNITLNNCEFNNNTAEEIGGAVYSTLNSTIEKTIFCSNHAKWGGAIYSTNMVLNTCEFNNNTAENSGAAVYSKGNCSIEKVSFNTNFAKWGGAIYLQDSHCHISQSTFYLNIAQYGGAVFSNFNSILNIENSDFTENFALISNGGVIYSENILNINDSNFKTSQNKAIISSKNNSSYFSLKNNRMFIDYEDPTYFKINGQSYTPQLYLVFNNITTVKGNSVKVCQVIDKDKNSYVMGDINLALNNAIIHYNDDSGEYLLDTSSINYGIYKLKGSLENRKLDYTVCEGTLKIVKKSVIYASTLTKTYGTGNKLSLTLKDDKGNAIKNANVKVKLSGKTYTVKTNSKGQATLAINLAVNTYTATITYSGNDQYSSANKQVKIVVKKATPKLTAGKKTFKVKTSNKKYTITLKNNLGKAMKNTKVTITVNGKTYTAKTNSKGQATLTLKITKKGTHKATVKYGGNKNYNAVTKTTTITVKK